MTTRRVSAQRGDCALALDHLDIYAWAHTVHVATSTERLVLTTLAHLLGPSGEGRVSQRQIAESARVTDRTVRRVLAVLAASGDVTLSGEQGQAPTIQLMATTATPRTRDPGHPGHTIRCTPDTRSGEGGHTIRGGSDTVSGVQAGGDTPTVSPKKIPPYSPPTAEKAGDEDDDGRASPLDHFAPRRTAEPSSAEITPERWQAIEAALSGRTLDRRSRFMGEGLTAVETARVRGFIEAHGLDTVERVIASMPDRVSKPTAYLAKCLERVEADQRDAARGRAALEAAPAPAQLRSKLQESSPEDLARIEALFAETFALFAEPEAS